MSSAEFLPLALNCLVILFQFGFWIHTLCFLMSHQSAVFIDLSRFYYYDFCDVSVSF